MRRARAASPSGASMMWRSAEAEAALKAAEQTRGESLDRLAEGAAKVIIPPSPGSGEKGRFTPLRATRPARRRSRHGGSATKLHAMHVRHRLRLGDGLAIVRAQPGHRADLFAAIKKCRGVLSHVLFARRFDDEFLALANRCSQTEVLASEMGCDPNPWVDPLFHELPDWTGIACQFLPISCAGCRSSAGARAGDLSPAHARPIKPDQMYVRYSLRYSGALCDNSLCRHNRSTAVHDPVDFRGAAMLWTQVTGVSLVEMLTGLRESIHEPC